MVSLTVTIQDMSLTFAKGTKNSQHANQKAKAAAQQRYEKAKSEYLALKSKPNKTPEDKKKIDKLKKSMDKARLEAEFAGENHSRNAKGN